MIIYARWANFVYEFHLCVSFWRRGIDFWRLKTEISLARGHRRGGQGVKKLSEAKIISLESKKSHEKWQVYQMEYLSTNCIKSRKICRNIFISSGKIISKFSGNDFQYRGSLFSKLSKCELEFDVIKPSYVVLISFMKIFTPPPPPIMLLDQSSTKWNYFETFDEICKLSDVIWCITCIEGIPVFDDNFEASSEQ